MVRNRVLAERDDQECNEKKLRQKNGRTVLMALFEERKRKIKSQRIKNKEDESAFKLNQSTNTVTGWNRVLSLIDIAASNYKGTKDISRMRQVISTKAKSSN